MVCESKRKSIELVVTKNDVKREKRTVQQAIITLADTVVSLILVTMITLCTNVY